MKHHRQLPSLARLLAGRKEGKVSSSIFNHTLEVKLVTLSFGRNLFHPAQPPTSQAGFTGDEPADSGVYLSYGPHHVHFRLSRDES